MALGWLLNLGFAGSAVSGGADTDYYVDASMPDDTGDGLSWETAKQLINSALTLAAAEASSDTINIADGTYVENLNLSSANLSNTTITGESRTGTIVEPSSGHTLRVQGTVTGLSVDTLTLRAVGAKNALLRNDGATDLSITSVIFESTSTHSDHLFRSQGSSGLAVSKCEFRNKYTASQYPMYLEGDTAGQVDLCIFRAANHSHFSHAVQISSSGTLTFYNCVILDPVRYGLSQGGSGTATIANSIVQGGSVGLNGYCLNRGAGTLNANSNYLISGTKNSAGWVSAGVTEGTGDDANIKTNANPKFATYPRGGAILPRMDDSGNLSYVQSVAAILEPYGFEGCWNINMQSWSSANTAAARTLIEGGTIQLASHGYTHSKLTMTGTLFTISGGTVTIDRSADTITFSGGGSVSGFRAKTLDAIKTELEGLGATVTPHADYDTVDGIKKESLGEVFDDGAATTTMVLLHDATGATGVEKVEITDAKTLQEAEINGAGNITDGQTGDTYACNSFAFPYNSSDATTRAAVRAAGYWAGLSTVDTIDEETTLIDVDLFHIGGYANVMQALGGDESGTRQAARALAFAAAHTGQLFFVGAHTADDLSLEQWGWICDEWEEFGDSIRVTSPQLLAQEVRESGNWADDGDGTYSRTFDYADLRPLVGSPLIDAGTDVGLATDFNGVTIPRGDAPNLGVHEVTVIDVLDVVDPQYVIVGQDNYTGGDAGTFAVPAESDVRDGTGYGDAGTEFEGTLVVPDYSSVTVSAGRVQQICEALIVLLDAADLADAFYEDIGATRSYTTLSDLTDVGDSVVAIVAPQMTTRARDSNGTYGRYVVIDILVRIHLTNDAAADRTTMDNRAYLLEQIDNYLAAEANRELTLPSSVIAEYIEPTDERVDSDIRDGLGVLWDSDDLLDKRQVTGLVRVAYWVDEDY